MVLLKSSNFIGMTKEEAKKQCNNLNIICSFYNTLSDKKEGTVISQSIEKDTEIGESQNIDIEIATKKQAEVTKKKETTNTNKQNTTNNNSNKSNNNTNNNQQNNQNTQPQNTCKQYDLNLGTGNNGDQTKQIIIGQNPNLKFSWNPVNSCPNGDTTPGTICSSSASDGTAVSNCSTITITYVK